MINLLPFILFVAIGLTWVALFIQSHRLFYRFRESYPDIAKAEIPYAFEINRHHEKFFYFFRNKSIKLLKSNRHLWKLRNQVMLLSALSLLVPFCSFLVLILVLIRWG